MNTALEVLLLAILVPAALAAGVAYSCGRWLPTGAGTRYAGALGMGIGFAAGYALLPQWAPLIPNRHWQWLPYLGCLAMILGPLGRAQGISSVERWLLYLLLGISAACLLVPTWDSLQPSRLFYSVLLGGYVVLLSGGLEPLPDRVSPKLFETLLAFAALAVAITIAAVVSVRYGRLAILTVSTLLGCSAAGLLHHPLRTQRGLLLVYVVLVGGCAFIGCIEPQPAVPGILALPATPLALWAVESTPLIKRGGRTLLAARVAAVMLAVTAALLWIWIDLRG